MKRSLTLLFLTLVLFVPEARSDENPVLTLRSQVQQEFQRHNFRKVIKLYRDFAPAHPDLYLPYDSKVFYSQSLADTGDIDEAIKILKEVLTDLPQQVDSLKLQYDLANLLFMQRRYQEARSAYQKILLQGSRYHEIQTRARERIALMKEGESRKKDVVALQLLDIETSLEASEVPGGAVEILQGIIDQHPVAPQADQAKRLLEKIKEVRGRKAAALLDEARRLFDEERKYTEVRQILEEIKREYPDVGEMQSVELLLRAADQREGRGR